MDKHKMKRKKFLTLYLLLGICLSRIVITAFMFIFNTKMTLTIQEVVNNKGVYANLKQER